MPPKAASAGASFVDVNVYSRVGRAQEDRYTPHPRPLGPGVTWLCVYDGHGCPHHRCTATSCTKTGKKSTVVDDALTLVPAQLKAHWPRVLSQRTTAETQTVLREAVADAFEVVNDTLKQRYQRSPEAYERCGACLVGVVVDRRLPFVTVVQLGDCAAALCNGEGLIVGQRHTRPHVSSGVTADDGLAISHALGDFTIRGVQRQPEVHFWTLPSVRPFYLILCTDGLLERSGKASLDRISEAKAVIRNFTQQDHRASLEELCESLVDWSDRRNKGEDAKLNNRDDRTVLVMRADST